MKRGSVNINFTIGFGNNLFQYAYGRLLAEKYNLILNHSAILPLGIPERQSPIDKNMFHVTVGDNNCKNVMENFHGPANYHINGYFEDYELYKPHIKKIRSWFSSVEKTNNKDLILHMRLQNRLVQESHHKNHITAEGFKKGIQKFDFDRLHIVTDAEKWDYYTEEDIEKIRYHIKIGPNPNEPWVPVSRSLEHMNSLIDGLKEYDPVVHCNGAKMIKKSGGLRDNFIDDFNLIRSFNKIMFYNSTFSWWASLLSDATQIGVFGPWKPRKHNCRNLGKTDYPGWFSWGSAEDLYWKNV